MKSGALFRILRKRFRQLRTTVLRCRVWFPIALSWRMLLYHCQSLVLGLACNPFSLFTVWPFRWVAHCFDLAVLQASASCAGSCLSWDVILRRSIGWAMSGLSILELLLKVERSSWVDSASSRDTRNVNGDAVRKDWR